MAIPEEALGPDEGFSFVETNQHYDNSDVLADMGVSDARGEYYGGLRAAGIDRTIDTLGSRQTLFVPGLADITDFAVRRALGDFDRK